LLLYVLLTLTVSGLFVFIICYVAIS